MGAFFWQGKHKPYLTIQSRDYAVPGWPSWLGRETHRVNTIIARFLRHLEVAGSNPAPGTYLLVSLEWHGDYFLMGSILSKLINSAMSKSKMKEAVR